MSAPNTPAWWVESQRETTNVSPAGRLVSGVELAYSTRAGHSGTVFVPDTDYRDVDKVKAAVGAAAAHADAVGSLTADDVTGA